MGAFWLENRILLLRWWFRLRREPLTLLSTLAQPVLWLLLFGHLLARMAAGEVPGGDYLRFMTAGAMVMTVFNGAEGVNEIMTGVITQGAALLKSLQEQVASAVVDETDGDTPVEGRQVSGS